MPPHQERIQKNNEGICVKCLRNPIAFFASKTYMGINRTSLCEQCLEEIAQKNERT